MSERGQRPTPASPDRESDRLALLADARLRGDDREQLMEIYEKVVVSYTRAFRSPHDPETLNSTTSSP